jgi:HK97 gp10 family phage protein
MSIELTGMKEMLAKMTEIREYVRTEGARKAVSAGGKVMKVAMVEKTPVLIERNVGSSSLEPGEIKRSIRVRVRMEDDEAVALIGPTGKDGEPARAAHLVEYGHRMVVGGESRMDAAGIFVGPGHALEKDVPAHPFLRPAFEESAAGAMEAVAKAFGEGLREAAK